MSGVLFYNKCRIKTDVLTSLQLTEAEEKDVNFYDYDGFRLLSYTNEEALALTELPVNTASNDNLTFDEWNWTLADIKTQINTVGGVVNVGAIYHTTDDKTHITCKPTETFPQAHICLTPTVANAVTVNWGDDTTSVWTSTSQATKSHTYTGVTDSSVYDITISCSSGTYRFGTNITGSSAKNTNCIYTDIKLSNKVTSLGTYCFQVCYSLQTITIPNSITSLSDGCFYDCYSLQPITIPSSVTSFGHSCFKDCYSLRTITIPNSITSLSDGCFYDCYSLQFITIPNNVTSLGSSCFYVCYSLQSVTIPDAVTSLGAQCFGVCYSLQKIYCKPTTPPTMSNANTITNISNLVIYVPNGTLSAYQSAGNWSSFASKMVEYNF